jgi:hypothetical protein
MCNTLVSSVRISDLPSPPAIDASNTAGFIPNPEVYTFQSTVTGSRHGSTDSLVSYIIYTALALC